MWASASSDMFSINITKKNNNIENKAEQNKTREGEEVKGRMQKKNVLIKVQKLGNGWENKKMQSAEIGFDRYISLLTGGAKNCYQDDFGNA